MQSISRFNHSRDCNILHIKLHDSQNEFVLVTARDILPNEELTIFYNNTNYDFENSKLFYFFFLSFFFVSVEIVVQF